MGDFLREKSDIFRTFKIRCKEMESEIEISPKVLRTTDNRLEYLSKEFDLFCQEKGIKWHKTVPANPQLNGVAKRMNKSTFYKTYLINKCPAFGIGGAIPDERWYGEESDYLRLGRFGCKLLHAKNKENPVEGQ